MNSPAERFDDIGIGSVTDELQPGTRLLNGQFTIDGFLNAGGFGITYLARDSLDRRVVVKECFPSSYCRRSGTLVAPRTRQREEDFRSVVRLFVQEAMTLSRLQHDNIVKVHQVFEDNDTAYMAMEYIDGPDLLETIEGTAPALQPAQICAILDQMLDAIGHVHAQGVLHRDISPDNILLERSTGRPVLIDFGASRKEVTRKSRALSGLRVVKDGYSPQEFYIGGSLQGPNSDLYAMAATLCHLVTGTTPRTSQERLSAIASRQGDPQPSVVGRASDYPVEFLKAIDKGMSIFPRDRFQSVTEWQTALRGGARRPVAVPASVTAAAAAAVQTAPQGPLPAHVLPAVPVHALGGRSPAFSAPVMAPIPAPAATLASAAPTRAEAAAAPSAPVEMPDPTEAVKAAIAEAARASEQAPTLPEAGRKAPSAANPAAPVAPAVPVATVKVAVAAAAPSAVAMPSGVRTVRSQPADRAHPTRAAQVPQPALAAASPTDRRSRGLLVATAAAILVAAGFLALPTGRVEPVAEAAKVPMTADTGLLGLASVALANGILLQTVETANGPRAMVSVLPDGVATDLQIGDILVVYAATGEVVDGAEAVNALLEREAANGIATFGFAVQRDGKMAVGYIELPRLGQLDPALNEQDGEKKT